MERPFNADDILVASILAGKPKKLKRWALTQPIKALTITSTNDWHIQQAIKLNKIEVPSFCGDKAFLKGTSHDSRVALRLYSP